MGTRRSRLRVWLLIAAAIIVLLLMFLAYVYAQLMGWGGWEPNTNSAYAKRAHLINSQLKIGMSRDAVTAIFDNDAAQYHADRWGNNSHTYGNPGEPPWADEADLYVFEPRRHFWNSFDTLWEVRAGFDEGGRLNRHTIDPEDCCGP